jgi:acetylornithine deacetylase
LPHHEGEHLFGLGSADTKGAIAAIVAAAEVARPRDTLVLFSGDEEHGATCMRHFLASPHRQGLERAVVCEPTSMGVGTRHRGIMSFVATATGIGGHSSRADERARPLAELARAAVRIDDWGRKMLGAGPPGFAGMCVNIAGFSGGVAFNVIPTHAELVFSVRPPPGVPLDEVQSAIAACVPERISLATTLANPSFQTRDPSGFRPLLGARVDSPVDLGYWTEAALLSEAGIDTVVMGPGSIAVAHAPDEHVPIAELDEAQRVFTEMFHGSH